jgi:hypothetical protein
MLKTLPWRVMAWGCSIGVLAGLLAVAFELFQGQICEYNQATEHEECTTYSLVPFLLIQVGKPLNDYGVAITALATVAIGFFTLTLKLSTDKLWEAGEKQRQLYEETAQRQLRAYVFVSGARIVHGITDNNILEVYVEIKNSGQTPAYKMMAVNGLHFDTYPPPQPLTLTVPDQNYSSLRTRMDLGPGDKTFTDMRAGRLLTPVEKDSLIAGTRAVWVYGEIRYRDAFLQEAMDEISTHNWWPLWRERATDCM